MATVRRVIVTRANAGDVWSAIRDVGALHTRLVPGFVVDTRLEGSVRIVTFGNGTVLREPIVTIDEAGRRLVWSAEGGITQHYNASVQVFATDDGGLRGRVDRRFPAGYGGFGNRRSDRGRMRGHAADARSIGRRRRLSAARADAGGQPACSGLMAAPRPASLQSRA